MIDWDPALIDGKILKLLINASTNNGEFYGWSVSNTACALKGLPLKCYKGFRAPTEEEVKATARALRVLEKQGAVYSVKRSRARYFPSGKAIIKEALMEQREITEYGENGDI